MLRTSQMMLGETLSRCFLGRDYSLPQGHKQEEPRAVWIIRLFMDLPDRPFSLQRISTRGEKYDKKIGSWFGPSAAVYVMRDLVRAFNSPAIPLRVAAFSHGAIYIRSVEHLAQHAPSTAGPNDLVYQDIRYPFFTPTPLPPYQPPAGQPTPIFDRILAGEDPAASSSSQPTSSDGEGRLFYPTLVLITCTLGQKKVTPEAAENVKYFLSHPSSVGIVGGKPNSSYYFYATREEYVYYLNPHQTQQFVRDDHVAVDSPPPTQTYHGGGLHQKMKISNLDPSCCFGFLFQTRAEWDSFVEEMNQYRVKNVLFSVEEKRASFIPKDSGEYEP